MQYVDCGNPCERSCREVAEGRPSSSACTTMCRPPGCYCKPGFVRFYNNQQCVSEPDCFLARKK
uniref:TIL domain-containing protein n=1 Tax=Romanomermis culicivorax TaxID=13658 RepID=A0A915IVS5_ROMCU